ncbi:hypothetical protein D0T50_11095 [Bacteroides sp. 214]|uniref:fimbrillin family protein n=1 Tax=Bacteroides sp. 214 TaxID=2302935 RepID=UPI0013D818F3|nr:fimbrillin family protein [Bacteroides sp. 214]NDW13435.1 hypothetical protein [Bacteroides sp. 214]
MKISICSWVMLCLSISVMTSCVNNIPSEKSEKGRIPIGISAKVKQEKTRVTDTAFEENDAIGLYVTIQPNTLEDEIFISNTKFVNSNQVFTPETTKYYPEESAICDFIAYYPYKKKGITAGTTIMDITTKANQSEWSSYSISDFLTAKNSGIEATKDFISMQFDHKLCKINIRLKPGESHTPATLLESKPSIKLVDIYSKATYDFSADEFSNQSSITDITPYGEWEIGENELVGKCALIIPQTFNAKQTFIEIEVNEETFRAVVEEEHVLESGKSFDYQITLAEKLAVSISPSVNGWEEPTQKEEKAKQTTVTTSISINDLPFLKSSIYNVFSGGVKVAEICKEYLVGTSITAQAIVAYPTAKNKTNLAKGIVLKIINETEEKHGGSLAWNTSTNTFTYTAGTSSPIEKIYIAKDSTLCLSQPEEMLFIDCKEFTLTDIRGTESITYPITKIGTQYWMAANLQTTKYSDGTAIALKDDFTGTTARVCTPDNEFYYYNIATISTGLIAPNGWRVSSSTDWGTLKTYIVNNCAALKKGEAWKTSGQPATNLTGFNIDPIGLYNKSFTNSIFAGYWSMKNGSSSEAEKTIMLSSTNNSINEGAVTNASLGIAIRCIKE